ncbi:MAG: Dihydroxyacetone kinase, ATP-dependent (EC [uncultured Caballeronia sp.]|nr:MAG: Dihydroxyacetone kinase, ATP-dependent (EC [uncultured Caballeronia sp.]
MKKLINDVSGVVPDMLDGLAALNPGLSLLQGSTIIVRADAEAAVAGEVCRPRPMPPSSMPFAPWPVLRASF